MHSLDLLQNIQNSNIIYTILSSANISLYILIDLPIGRREKRLICHRFFPLSFPFFLFFFYGSWKPNLLTPVHSHYSLSPTLSPHPQPTRSHPPSNLHTSAWAPLVFDPTSPSLLPSPPPPPYLLSPFSLSHFLFTFLFFVWGVWKLDYCRPSISAVQLSTPLLVSPPLSTTSHPLFSLSTSTWDSQAAPFGGVQIQFFLSRAHSHTFSQ